MELSTITTPAFYSANFGTDEPIRPFPRELTPHGTTVLFTDRYVDPEQRAGWDLVMRVDPTIFAPTPRRAARYVKLNAHLMFPGVPWSVWFDQTHMPVTDLAKLRSFLPLSDIACFKHPQRSTAREEAEKCKELQLDEPQNINKMLRFFESVDFPDTYGLYGTACVVRAHTPEIVALNSLWWWACQRYTQRDQIILPWVCWQLGIVPTCLEGKPRADEQPPGVVTKPNPYFEVTVW